jgi:excisionase family DNA binding protein
MQKLLRVSDVCDVLNLSERTVRRLIASGQLRAMKIRGSLRVSDAELHRFVARAESRL